jgi:hypothetical protein
MKRQIEFHGFHTAQREDAVLQLFIISKGLILTGRCYLADDT